MMDSIRLLVIDDDPQLRRALQEMLSEHYNWHVSAVGDPGDAVEMYNSHDVVLSDWSMPNGGGARVLAESGRPVVIHSAIEDVPHRYVVRKPARLERIHDMIVKALRAG